MDLSFIGNNSTLIAVVLVAGFLLWKFVMQPIMNEGKPIEPAKDHKFIGEQLDEAVQEAVGSTERPLDI